MRLIDADALEYHRKLECIGVVYEWEIDNAPTIDAVPVETVCKMFGNEAPCNYVLFGVSVDDFMMSKCWKWCEDNCDKVSYTECWRKFLEEIEKGESHDQKGSS